MDLKEKIIKYRKEHNISQYVFAETLGISRSYISDIESGRINGSIELIRKLNNATNISCDYWINNDIINSECTTGVNRNSGLTFLESALDVIIENGAYDKNLKIIMYKDFEMLKGLLEKEIQKRILIKESELINKIL